MTLTQLEYLVAVDAHRHFGQAARACHVTQPTLSMQLRKLEDELGVVLFDRSKSPVLPTAEGARVLERARAVLREQRLLIETARRARDELEGDFRLAVIPTLSTYVLPLFLGAFARHYPSVDLVIEESKTEDIVEQLHEARLDAGLLATPLHEEGVIERVLFYEPFQLFVAPNHPLARRRRVAQSDLDIDEIWLLNKGNCLRDQVLQICNDGRGKRPGGASGGLRFQSGNLETLKNMVLANSGYTILPELAVAQLSAPHRKLVRPFRPPVPTREVSLVCSRNVLGARVLDALAEEIVAALPDAMRRPSRRRIEVIEFVEPPSPPTGS